MKIGLRFAALGVATIGLLVSLADEMEWIPNPRGVLAAKIVSLGDNVLPLETDGVEEFLRHFLGEAKYKTFQASRQEMSGIAIEDIRLNTDAFVFGTVYLQHVSGKRHQLCGFPQMQSWASERHLPFWIGWCVAAVGVLLAWLIDILDMRSAYRASGHAEIASEVQGLPRNVDVLASVERGLADSAAGRVTSRGSFAQQTDESDG